MGLGLPWRSSKKVHPGAQLIIRQEAVAAAGEDLSARIAASGGIEPSLRLQLWPPLLGLAPWPMAPHMDETASLFCAQYGVCFSPETLRIRANSHHKVLDIDKDKKAASVLRDALRPDLAVYDLAVLLFDQNIAQVPNWARSRVLPGERV